MIQPVGKPPEVSLGLYPPVRGRYGIKNENEGIGARLSPNMYCDRLEGDSARAWRVGQERLGDGFRRWVGAFHRRDRVVPGWRSRELDLLRALEEEGPPRSTGEEQADTNRDALGGGKSSNTCPRGSCELTSGKKHLVWWHYQHFSISSARTNDMENRSKKGAQWLLLNP